MAETSLSIQYLSEQENNDVYDTPVVIKQERFITENFKNDCHLIGEYALDLKSPEFDLENIATECPIDSEQPQLLNNSKHEDILPRIKRKKLEIGNENMETRINTEEGSDTESENIDPTDCKIKVLKKESLFNNPKNGEIELNKSEEILPKKKKVEIGIENTEHIINKLEGRDTESDESKNYGFNINVLSDECLINNFKKDEIELSKSEDILQRIKKEKVEIGIENMEPIINKAEGSTTVSKNFDSANLKIKVLNEESLINNYNKGELELMQIESMKTESSIIIKDEEIISDAISRPNTVQNQNVRFNLLSKNRANTNININVSSKSKSDKKIKSKTHKSKNKLLSSKVTQLSSVKPKTGSGNYECPYCGYKCKYDAIFQDHLLSHVNTVDMFSCRICNFKGKNKQHYDYHMNAGHDDKKMNKCVSCDYKNTCDNQFRLHLTEKGHKVKCPKCDLVFENRINLRRHLIEHETKIYECSVCKRMMKYKNLKSHLLTHTREFECKVCGYKTSGNKRLKDHMKVHTKEKPYECQLCTKSFRLEFGLKNHMLSHQNRESRKLYECDVCKKTYLSHQALKLHFKKKNHGPTDLSMDIDDILVKRTKALGADKITL